MELELDPRPPDELVRALTAFLDASGLAVPPEPAAYRCAWRLAAMEGDRDDERDRDYVSPRSKRGATRA